MTGAIAQAAWQAAGTLAEPALRLLLARRVRLGKEDPARLAERRGIDVTPRPEGRLVWVHAASVGETISVLPVLHAIAARRQPAVALLLTTGTRTSAALAAERLPPGALHRYVPLDVPRWAGRFLDHWRPDAACFVESEIWPTLLGAARARGIPLMLLNARLSDRSYAAWRRLPGLARRVFGGFTAIRARSAGDAERLTALAGRAVAQPGDLKFAAPALPADAAALAALRATLGGRPCWIAASLHPGEDAVVVDAHRRLAAGLPGLVTLLVPRHPRRGAAMAAAQPMARRSAGDALPPGGLYLADTLGELGLLYRLASCAFVGGSLVAHGGHNPLEPARLGLPVAIGPHAGNFADACAALRAAGALATVADAAELAAWAAPLLADPRAAAGIGARGQAAASRWAGLPEESAATLLAMIPGGDGQ